MYTHCSQQRVSISCITCVNKWRRVSTGYASFKRRGQENLFLCSQVHTLGLPWLLREDMKVLRFGCFDSTQRHRRFSLLEITYKSSLRPPGCWRSRQFVGESICSFSLPMHRIRGPPKRIRRPFGCISLRYCNSGLANILSILGGLTQMLTSILNICQWLEVVVWKNEPTSRGVLHTIACCNTRDAPYNFRRLSFRGNRNVA